VDARVARLLRPLDLDRARRFVQRQHVRLGSRSCGDVGWSARPRSTWSPGVTMAEAP